MDRFYFERTAEEEGASLSREKKIAQIISNLGVGWPAPSESLGVQTEAACTHSAALCLHMASIGLGNLQERLGVGQEMIATRHLPLPPNFADSSLSGSKRFKPRTKMLESLLSLDLGKDVLFGVRRMEAKIIYPCERRRISSWAQDLALKVSSGLFPLGEGQYTRSADSQEWDRNTEKWP